MPSREGYGETHSASRFHDFQARRLKMRYRRKDTKKVAFCHTLNNTVAARTNCATVPAIAVRVSRPADWMAFLPILFEVIVRYG